MEIIENFSDMLDAMDNDETVYWTRDDMDYYDVVSYWYGEYTQMFDVYIDGESVQEFNANDFENYRKDGIEFCAQMVD